MTRGVFKKDNKPSVKHDITSTPLSVHNLIVHQERPNDSIEITRMHREVFGPGRFVRPSYRLREREGSRVDALCRVACVNERIAASVRVHCVRIGEEACLWIGPLVVAPNMQRLGLGSRLMHDVLERAKAPNYSRLYAYCLLIGDLSYYQRFGFHVIPKDTLLLTTPFDPRRVLWFPLRNQDAFTLTGMVYTSSSGPQRIQPDE